MPITHNQINAFWSNPTYNNFKTKYFNKKVFTKDDADLFNKIGAYLIQEAKGFSKTHTAWNEKYKYRILKNPILENIDFTLGSEYLMKGVFLCNGYAINLPLKKGLTHPIELRNNLGKLSKVEVQTIDYIVTHIGKIIDFSEFDTKQKTNELMDKKRNSGEKIPGITKLGIPHPNSKQILDYIQYKRNFSLHRPFIATEFSGLTKQLFDFMDYIAIKGTGENIETLAKLTNP